jgi:hypothetical protein
MEAEMTSRAMDQCEQASTIDDLGRVHLNDS